MTPAHRALLRDAAELLAVLASLCRHAPESLRAAHLAPRCEDVARRLTAELEGTC